MANLEETLQAMKRRFTGTSDDLALDGIPLSLDEFYVIGSTLATARVRSGGKVVAFPSTSDHKGGEINQGGVDDHDPGLIL